MLKFAIPLFAVALINIILAIIIFSRRKGRAYNFYYSLVTLSLAGWAFGLGMFYIDSQAQFIRFWTNFLYLSGTFIATFLLTFSLTFYRRARLKKRYCFLILVPAVVIGFLLFKTNLIIDSVYSSPTRSIDYGLWTMLFVGHFIIYMAITFYVLFRTYSKLFGASRVQVQYAIYGTLITTILGSITNVVLPVFDNFSYFHIGPYFTLVMVISFLYAITRYGLLDIKTIVIRSLAFSFIIVFASGLLTFITVFLTQLIGIDSLLATSVILSILVSIGYKPLRSIIEKITKNFLYKKSYNPDTVLSDISDKTSSLQNLNQLLQSVSQTILEAFGTDKISYALINEDKTVSIPFETGFKPGVSQKIIQSRNILKTIYKQFSRQPGIQVIEEMKIMYDNGEYIPDDPKLLNELYDNDVALVVALKEKDLLRGVIAIGNRKSGDPYTAVDLRTLSIATGQIAIAIKNAILYEAQKQFNATLKKKVDEATADLRKANARLKQMDESKSEFLSIAAHQLRTPITGIKGYVSMFLEGDFGSITDAQKIELEKMYRSSDRLARLIDVFLNVSRIETGRLELKKELCDINQIVDDVVGDLGQQAKKKNLEITVQKPDEPLPKMFMDKDKIQDVVMNLVDNSIKYTQQGWINIRLSRSKSLFSFEVRDSGIGIDSSEIDKLFQKFSRAEAVYRIHTGGSGLGLFIARKIIEAHGGRIWAESEGKGKGSIFTFTLPIEEMGT